MTTFTFRRAARVLLVDGAGRLLLLHGHDPARPDHGYWFTPGGGLAPGETPAAGAARELAEETGLRLDPDTLVGPVWREQTEFLFDGRLYRQEQEFFLVRVASWTVDTAGFDPIERATIDAYRWWTPEEMAGTSERIYPADLAEVLDRALEAAGADAVSDAGGSRVALASDASAGVSDAGGIRAALEES